jgi:hypothetical protein
MFLWDPLKGTLLLHNSHGSAITKSYPPHPRATLKNTLNVMSPKYVPALKTKAYGSGMMICLCYL